MSVFQFPDQTIAESQKDRQFHMDHILGYVGDISSSNSYLSEKEEILKYYRGYNAELSEEEAELVKPITCPHGEDLGQEYIVYPLIQSKIEQVTGEFMLRPLRRTAYVMDKGSKNKKFNEKLSMAAEEIMRELTQETKQSLGFEAQTENPEMQIPEDIEAFFENDYKTIEEQVANSLLKLFLDVNKEKHKFKYMFTDYAICDRAHSRLDKSLGHTTQRKIHPLDCDYDLDPYKVVQNDHEFFFENYFLSENEIYNSYELDKDQKLQVAEIFRNLSGDGDDFNVSGTDGLGSSLTPKGWVQTSNKTFKLRCVYAMWKSRKSISIKESETKQGQKIHKKLPEDYKPRKKDKIKKINGEMPRFCIMLGPDIVLDWGVMKERYSRVDAKWKCSLPVVSIVRDNALGSSKIKSIAAKLYPLQQMASEVLFELRLAFKSAGDSRILVYDTAQTPKDLITNGSVQSGLNKVLHHAKKDKFMFINSAEKGHRKNTFNQFTSLDMSAKGAVNDLMTALGFIEDLAAKFVGISPEREGQVHQNQTATGTDKAIRGSTARTEIIFTPFDEFIQAILEKALMKMKYDYEEGEVIQYIIGDMKTKFIKVFKEFFAADLGLYLADSGKDYRVAEQINQAAQMAVSGANTPEMMLGLIEVLEGDTASEKKEVFRKLLKSLDQVREMNQKAAQEAQQAELQAKAQEKADSDKLTREGYINNIDVAEIYKSGKSNDTLQKISSDERKKAAELDIKREENSKKE